VSVLLNLPNIERIDVSESRRGDQLLVSCSAVPFPLNHEKHARNIRNKEHQDIFAERYQKHRIISHIRKRR
jgi:hypothetical protein